MGLVLSVLNFTGVHILHLLGFGTTGVSAGSIAAGLQPSSTLAGGLFAMAQSAGATGAGALAATTGGATMGAFGGVIWLVRKIVRRKL